MKISDHLSKRQQEQLEKMRLNLPKKDKEGLRPNMVVYDEFYECDQKDSVVLYKRSESERLSRRDLEDLMGTRRDTYKRKNGAVRRK